MTVWNSDSGKEHIPSECQLVMKEGTWKMGDTINTILIDKEGEVEMRLLNGSGLNLPLSNLLSELLEPIAGEMEGRCEKFSPGVPFAGAFVK